MLHRKTKSLVVRTCTVFTLDEVNLVSASHSMLLQLTTRVLIRASTLIDLQCNIVARQVETKTSPILLGLEYMHLNLSTYYIEDKCTN